MAYNELIEYEYTGDGLTPVAYVTAVETPPAVTFGILGLGLLLVGVWAYYALRPSPPMSEIGFDAWLRSNKK
jgi:hypothetical protein